MEATVRVRRFTGIDRLIDVFLIVTFTILAFAGTAQVLIDTDWGRQLLCLRGGYQQGPPASRSLGHQPMYTVEKRPAR